MKSEQFTAMPSEFDAEREYKSELNLDNIKTVNCESLEM